jgi:hypothetical protein
VTLLLGVNHYRLGAIRPDGKYSGYARLPHDHTENASLEMSPDNLAPHAKWDPPPLGSGLVPGYEASRTSTANLSSSLPPQHR